MWCLTHSTVQFLVLAAFCAINNSSPFCSHASFDPARRPAIRDVHRASNGQLDGYEEEDGEERITPYTNKGPEESQMFDFIRDYLDREEQLSTQATEDGSEDSSSPRESFSVGSNPGSDVNSNNNQWTHMIALPVDACHELLLELESVQRAILYHCPILVHACIAPAVTRLPLLLVNANNERTTAASKQLHQIVQDVVQDFVTAADDIRGSPQQTLDEDESPDAVLTSLDAVNREIQGEEDLTTANSQGTRPWLLSFETLEIDGSQNDVLLTVAKPKTAGTKKLQAFVQALRLRIQEAAGWACELPHDPQRDLSANALLFRPRIPFMRLPTTWKDIVREELLKDTTDDDTEVDMDLVLSDQGGNGISPIFWGQWSEDIFGEEIRMREVAIYRRRRTSGTKMNLSPETEQSFYLPEFSIPLPEGNDALSKLESKFESYQEKRMLEAEEAVEMEALPTDSSRDTSVLGEDEEDLLMTKTRERLEALYSQEEATIEAKVTKVEKEDTFSKSEPVASTSTNGETDIEEEADFDWRPVERPEDPSALDGWMRQRIQEAVASRARIQSITELARKKDKPPIAENPVFKKYKEGTLVPEQSKSVSVQKLPPFPSREHCTGFWRIVSSPTGFDVEEGDSSRSENLVLRVDGTIAGGPILDQESRQKASGGTWRMTGETRESARLRIRLVIPPKKERILVMEGPLEKLSMSSDLPLASSTFGIPLLEERAARSSTDIEDLLICNGNVWIEDALTKKNKNDIGKFSLMKLNVPTDPSQFTITIPKPIRHQD